MIIPCVQILSFLHSTQEFQYFGQLIMKSPATLFPLVFTIIFLPLSHSLSFIVLHGIGDQCSHRGMKQFTKLLSEWLGSEGYYVEIGDGSWDSWFMPLEDQPIRRKLFVTTDKVKQMNKLGDGYNIIGLSRGNLIGRAVAEFCEGGPPVKNFISLGDFMQALRQFLFATGIFCVLTDALIRSEIYSDYIQNMNGYLEKCRFLPKLNNEIPEERSSTYKERFNNLETLVLVMFEHDTVLVPKETSWFGYYPDGAFSPLLTPQEMKLYTEDWIGLKTLNVAGRVKFVSVVGNHLGMSHEDMKKHMVPYLKIQEEKLYHYKIKDAQAFVTRTKITTSQGSIMKDSSMYDSATINHYFLREAG